MRTASELKPGQLFMFDRMVHIVKSTSPEGIIANMFMITVDSLDYDHTDRMEIPIPADTKIGYASGIKVEPLTEEQIRAENREYNAYEWDRIINRYAALGGKFYVRRASGNRSYDSYYVVYVADGIRFLGTVSYSSSLTSGGFMVADVRDDQIIIRDVPVSDGSGYSMIGTNNEARAWMRAMTKKLDYIVFTKGF